MSRVVLSARSCARRAISLLLAAGLLVPAAGSPVAAQDLPLCDSERTTECQLPAWPGSAEAAAPSVFGAIDGVAWVEDDAGDAPEGGIDILAVGIGRVDIEDPVAVRKARGLMKLGKAKKAVTQGQSIVVRVVLDRAPSEVPGGHAGVHLVTDVDGSRSNNVPAGIARPDLPFAGSQDIYSLTWASTTGRTKLLASNLAKSWYKDKTPYAAAWAEPTVVDFLIKPSAFGAGFRVVTYGAGGLGGYDVASWGPVPLPTNGSVGLVPVCHEGAIEAEPFVIDRLNEGGETVRDVTAQASWRGGARIPVDPDVRPALQAWIATNDVDGDGRAGLQTWVNLFEDGVVLRQRPDLEIALDGDEAVMALELGLTRRGYNVLRDFQLAATDDPSLDAWLERAADTLRLNMPPFRLNRKSGLLVGDGIGSCVPWLSLPAEPEPTGSVEPTDTSEPDAVAETATPAEEATAASA